MGFMSDTEWELGPQDDDNLDTPPGSPNLAATQAQAIADNLPSNFLEQHGRTVRDYAALCCEEFELMDLDRDDVLKTSQLHSHLISIRQYTRMVALDRRVQRLIVESFLDSTEFKDHITRRIQFTFLDADVPFYVRGATARLIQHMQLNPASWHIPAVVHANFLTSKAFWKAIGAVTSNFRGDMRRKIRRSITDKLDIGALAHKLCIKGYQPTTAHWRRFALLRDYMNDWDKLPIKPGKSRRTPYWPFIDSKLDKLRELCKQPTEKCPKPTEKDIERALKDSLKTVVERDQKRYKGPASGKTNLPSKVHIPGWQKDHAKAVQEMAKYSIEAGPEDDADGEDDEEEDDATDKPGASNNGEAEAAGDVLGAPGAGGNGDGSTLGLEPLQGASNAPTGRVLVPGTQETARSASPMLETIAGPESQTPGASSSTLDRDERTGWAGGSLPDRPRRSHVVASPVSRLPTKTPWPRR